MDRNIRLQEGHNTQLTISPTGFWPCGDNRRAAELHSPHSIFSPAPEFFPLSKRPLQFLHICQIRVQGGVTFGRQLYEVGARYEVLSMDKALLL